MGGLKIYGDYMGNSMKCNGQDEMSMVTRQTYDRVAHAYGHSRCGKGAWRTELDLLRERLVGVRRIRLADLGCGTCRVLQYLIEEGRVPETYVGVDYSRPMLEEAAQWLRPLCAPRPVLLQEGSSLLKERPLGRCIRFIAGNKAPYTLHQASICEIDPDAEMVDVVVMAASFHHLLRREERETALELANWMLAPGGLLFVSTWDVTMASREKTDMGEGIWKVHFGGREGGDRYYYHVTRKEMGELLRYAGFTEIVFHELPTGNLVTMAKKG